MVISDDSLSFEKRANLETRSPNAIDFQRREKRLTERSTDGSEIDRDGARMTVHPPWTRRWKNSRPRDVAEADWKIIRAAASRGRARRGERGRSKLLLHFWSNAREPFNLDSSRESARSIREFRSPRRRVPRVRLTPLLLLSLSLSSPRPLPSRRFPRLGNSTVRDPMKSLSLSLSLSLLVPRPSFPFVDVILENNALRARAGQARPPRNRRPRPRGSLGG